MLLILKCLQQMIKYSAAWLYTDKLVCHPTFVSHQNCVKPLCFSLICFGAFFYVIIISYGKQFCKHGCE